MRVGQLRAWIYDRALLGLTPAWYREVLQRLPDRACLLDVGIGTGGALACQADLIRAKDLCIVGLDIDQDYLKRCRKTLLQAGLADYVSPRLESIYHHRGGPYDAVYFSASFMLLPQPVKALEHVIPLLTPTGEIFFTQTFHEQKSPLMEKLKPMLHRFTSIHFGRVSYWDDFQRLIAKAGLELRESALLGRTRRTSYRLAVTAPRKVAGLADEH